jgi:hypothetical protein
MINPLNHEKSYQNRICKAGVLVNGIRETRNIAGILPNMALQSRDFGKQRQSQQHPQS